MLCEVRARHRLRQPGAHSFCVCTGLKGGKCFRHDDNQRLCRRQLREYVVYMMAVDVCDVVIIDATGPEQGECLRGHSWPQIRAADTNVDDVFDGLAGGTFPFAASYGVCHGTHAIECFPDLAGCVVVRGVSVPQQGVERCPVFAHVDAFTTQHLVTRTYKTCLACQFVKQGQGPGDHEVTGIIQGKSGSPECHKPGSRRVLEQMSHLQFCNFRLVLVQVAPGIEFGGVHRVQIIPGAGL